MKTAVADTSISAYRAMPVKQLATQADRIEQIVADEYAAWGTDMSLREIQAAYRRLYCRTRGAYIDVSTVGARVNELIAANRLIRLETTRPCSNSQRPIHPVRVPG
jgi:hypothetical protein